MKDQFKQRISHGDFDVIMAHIRSELISAMDKFPEYPKDPIHAVAIMSEESGESVRAALQCVYEEGKVKDLHQELVQTAAMCIRMLSAITTGDLTFPNDESSHSVVLDNPHMKYKVQCDRCGVFYAVSSEQYAFMTSDQHSGLAMCLKCTKESQNV